MPIEGTPCAANGTPSAPLPTHPTPTPIHIYRSYHSGSMRMHTADNMHAASAHARAASACYNGICVIMRQFKGTLWYARGAAAAPHTCTSAFQHRGTNMREKRKKGQTQTSTHHFYFFPYRARDESTIQVVLVGVQLYALINSMTLCCSSCFSLVFHAKRQLSCS